MSLAIQVLKDDFLIRVPPGVQLTLQDLQLFRVHD